MNIEILDQYQIADDFEQLAGEIKFSAGVWNVAAELAGVSKPATPYELEKLTGQNSYQVREALERLLAKGLVRQDLISWEEFIAARKDAQDSKKTPAGGAGSSEIVTKKGVTARLGSIRIAPQTAGVNANARIARERD